MVANGGAASEPSRLVLAIKGLNGHVESKPVFEGASSGFKGDVEVITSAVQEAQQWVMSTVETLFVDSIENIDSYLGVRDQITTRVHNDEPEDFDFAGVCVQAKELGTKDMYHWLCPGFTLALPWL